LVYALFVLWGALTIVFVAVRVIPGDPAQMMIGPEGTQQDVAALRHRLGLDQPLVTQYARYLAGAVRLDFGTSLRLEEPATLAVSERLPATALLAASAMALAVAVGLPLGILAAMRMRSAVDYVVSIASLLGQSVPNFWLGIMFILIFAREFRWLPSAGIGGTQHLVLPAVTLALLLIGVLTRLVRSGLLEVVDEDYIRSAYAKGLSRRAVIARHALPNVLIPVVTIVGLQLGNLLAGAVIVETVFAWPGAGRLLVDAIGNRDYPVVQVAVLCITAGFILINLLVDVSYAYIDPRIRYR
jgi:peptide/nickel transport system permease protein/oligopeptide transport system permease protein